MAPRRAISGRRGPKKQRVKGDERHELRAVVRILTLVGYTVDDIVEDIFQPNQANRNPVRKFVKRWSANVSRTNVHDLPRSGRPSKLSAEQRKQIPRMLKKMATKNCKLLAKKLGVSPETIRKEARKTMIWKRRKKKQILTKKQMQERYDFAKHWLDVLEKDPEKFWEVWENALYSDES